MNTIQPSLLAIAEHLAKHRKALKRGEKMPKTFKPQRRKK